MPFKRSTFLPINCHPQPPPQASRFFTKKKKKIREKALTLNTMGGTSSFLYWTSLGSSLKESRINTGERGVKYCFWMERMSEENYMYVCKWVHVCIHVSTSPCDVSAIKKKNRKRGAWRNFFSLCIWTLKDKYNQNSKVSKQTLLSSCDCAIEGLWTASEWAKRQRRFWEGGGKESEPKIFGSNYRQLVCC